MFVDGQPAGRPSMADRSPVSTSVISSVVLKYFRYVRLRVNKYVVYLCAFPATNERSRRRKKKKRNIEREEEKHETTTKPTKVGSPVTVTKTHGAPPSTERTTTDQITYSVVFPNHRRQSQQQHRRNHTTSSIRILRRANRNKS